MFYKEAIGIVLSEWVENHLLILLLTAGALFTFIWLCCLKDRLRMKWYAALFIAILHTVFGVLTVKVFAFMETGFDPDSLGNMSLFGGVFFMPLAYWVGAKLFKRSPVKVFDIFTICMIFTVMCARINCIFAGCCFGLTIPGLGGLRWPTREMEIAFYIVLLLILARRVLHSKSHGEIYPLYMISYGAFRFIVEFFRYTEHPVGIFHLSHLWAIISLGLGLSIYAEIQTQRKKVRR